MAPRKQLTEMEMKKKYLLLKLEGLSDRAIGIKLKLNESTISRVLLNIKPGKRLGRRTKILLTTKRRIMKPQTQQTALDKCPVI